MDVQAENTKRLLSNVEQSQNEIRERKICESIAWLLEKSHGRETGRPHWEGVTWDTAAAIRSIARHLHSGHACQPSLDVDRAVKICGDALVWLRAEFRRWEEDVTYPFGHSDLAQILLTTIYLEGIGSPVLAAAFGRHEATSEIANFIESLASKLTSGATEVQDEVRELEGEMEELGTIVSSSWGDWFQSADVLLALALFVEREQEPTSPDSVSLSDDCHRRVLGAIQYIEYRQSDGRWGGHPETLRSLQAYLRATRALPGVGCEDQIVLKALRWICDPKQFFDDGSFLHSLYLTVFFSSTIFEIFSHWQPAADRTVMQVWDDALWEAPVRSTPERSKRLIVQIGRDRANARLRRARALQRRLEAAISFGIVLIITLLVSVAYKKVTINGDGGQILAVAGLVITVGLTVAGVVSRWPRTEVPSSRG
jgi:hypothetical protein